jgi:hypothetical protein
MDVLPLISTAAGAVIALSGALVADIGRDRRQRNRDTEQMRWSVYADFALALNAAHAGLRGVGETSKSTSELREMVNRALTDAELYGARERLLMIATEQIVKAGETVFSRLIDIRDVIRGGASTRSRQYHDVYHPYAEAIWLFRQAVRVDFRQRTFAPKSVDRPSWSERESCAFCGGTAT